MDWMVEVPLFTSSAIGGNGGKTDYGLGWGMPVVESSTTYFFEVLDSAGEEYSGEGSFAVTAICYLRLYLVDLAGGESKIGIAWTRDWDLIILLKGLYVG